MHSEIGGTTSITLYSYCIKCKTSVSIYDLNGTYCKVMKAKFTMSLHCYHNAHLVLFTLDRNHIFLYLINVIQFYYF